jgi:HEPN superfamily protein
MTVDANNVNVGPSVLWRAETVLGQSRALLADARAEPSALDRFRIAHLAALRGTAALLAVLTSTAIPVRRRPTSAWVLLERAMPEFADWATYFAAGQGRRAAAEAGLAGAVTPSEADDLVEATTTFLGLVEAAVVEASLRGGRADAPTLVAALGPLDWPPQRIQQRAAAS